MPRLLLVSTTTGYQARMFRDAAASIGVPLVLASDRCHVLEDPWSDGAIPVRFENLPESVAPVLEFARSSPLSGVAAIGDAPSLAAAFLCRDLHLPFHPPEAVALCCNKFLARQRYQDAGLPVPWFRRLRASADPCAGLSAIPFPCVIKPLGLSASRGVIRADTPAEFLAAFSRLRALLDSRDIRRLRDESSRWIQVEGYIPGREIAAECLVTHGRLRILAIFDKPDPLEGPFFEETIYVTPSRLDAATQHAVADTLTRAVKSLGLCHGPMHAEMRINSGGVWMLEMAARPIGGLCARALRFGSAGIPLEELILRHALGEPVENLAREQSASGVMMIPIPERGILEKVEGVEEASRLPGIESVEITAKWKQELIPLPEGSSYLGFIFARGGSPDFVESALRQAHSQLRFTFAASLPVV